MSTNPQSGRTTGWVGWIWFGALAIIMVGSFNIVDGLVALFKHNVYVQTAKSLVVFNFTTWGWILLILGAIQILIGAMLIKGVLWAQLAAIFIILLNAIAQITYITIYPLWSITVIILDVLVLWALCTHGDETQSGANIQSTLTPTK